MSAGKGSKFRPTDFKAYKENYPKPSGKLDGFVRVKGKLVKKY
jgi:hypothetical protein